MSTTKYSKSFKFDAINFVMEQVYTQTDAAKSLGIDRKLLHVWMKAHKSDTEKSFRGQGKLSEEQLEIRRLREEVKRLTMEKEILKKATACVPQAAFIFEFFSAIKKDISEPYKTKL